MRSVEEQSDDPMPAPGANPAPGRSISDLTPETEGGSATAGDTPEPAAPTTRRHIRRTRIVRWWKSPPVRWAVAIIVLFFIAEYLLLPDIASLKKSFHDLETVNVALAIVAIGLEVVSLLAYAELTHTVLSPGSPRRFELFRINMSSLAVSHIMPGGTAPGTALAYRLLTDREVPSGTAAFGLATQGVGSAVVLNAIFWLALLVSIPLTGYNPWYGYAALVGLILFALFAGTVIQLTRGQHRTIDALHHWASKIPGVNPDKARALIQTVADRLQILLRDRALLLHAIEWAAANWLFDAASLWVFLAAFGRLISPIDLLVAYGLANILAVLPITPSGLGIVEGILIPTLVGFHVPLTVATLSVLSYRLFNFWLPIPAGGGAYLSLRFGKDGKMRRNHRLHRAPRTGGARHPNGADADG